MLAMNNEKNQEQPINFDAIRIGLASPEKMAFSVRESLDQARTGNVIVVSTRRFVLRVLSVTVVV